MKSILKRIIAATSAVSMLLVSSALQAFSAGKPMGDEYELNGLDVSKAKTKPTIYISPLKLSYEDAVNAPVQTVFVCIKDAEKAYATAGFSVRYDERLTLVKTEDGDIAAKGPALSRVTATFTPDTANGFRAIIAGSQDLGKDGVMFNFDVKLPDDLKKGEKFPINIYYNKDSDLFTNALMDEDGQLMEAWLFTQGIEQGYIEVDPQWIGTTSTAPKTTASTTTSTVTTTTAAPSYTLGDANNDGKTDSVDASNILRKFAALSTGGTATENELAVCDVNADGKIDSVDASAVLAYYALLSSNQTDKSFIEYLKENGIRK